MPEILEFSKMSDEEVADSLKKHRIVLKVSEARHIEEILGRSPTLFSRVKIDDGQWHEIMLTYTGS